MMQAPLSPTRPPPPLRPRGNSHDIPRTYSGLFGDGNDLLPFELARNRNTEWLSNANWQLAALYLAVIFMVHLVILGFLDWDIAFTVTHSTHFVVTHIYLHWIKGSPDYFEQGEMNAMTCWEQLDATQNSTNAQRVLFIVPTILCYTACHFANYEWHLVLWNVIIWAISIVSKMPFMHGVRLLGINRTTGIDDDCQKRKSK
mmetsp:Transcript_23650/g.34912  ORF Transcript_23650/g.34912 Transcript_23650/m.34912 type:complete len:201 (+) Transcript_23650:185-787(+)